MTDEEKIIEEYVDKMMKSFSSVLFTEIQGLKEDIKEIKENVSKISDCLTEVNKWSSGHQAMHDALEKEKKINLNTTSVIISAIIMVSSLVFGFVGLNKKYEKVNDKIEIIDHVQKMQERYLQYKFKENPIVPTTRGGVIKKDTINKK